MSRTQLALWIAAAVLLFWSVGAYNRLVRLRNAVVEGFALVDEQFRRRQALLLQLADTLAAGDAAAADRLRAACAQADDACTHARTRPAAAGAITSLRLAEGILGDARRGLPETAPDDAAAAALMSELAAADPTLAFAREQFNAQVEAYNRALRQFPTWLLAGMFGFRPAGAL